MIRPRSIRVELDKTLSRDLELIRKELGLRNYSEVLRVLIKERAEQLRKQIKPESERPEPERPEHVTGVTSETEVELG